MFDPAVGSWLLPSSLFASSLASFALALRLPTAKPASSANRQSLDVASRVALIEALGAGTAGDTALLTSALKDPCLPVAALAVRHLYALHGSVAALVLVRRTVGARRARELGIYDVGL